MSESEDAALADSLKYGSGPAVQRQGSVPVGDKYGVGPYVAPEQAPVPVPDGAAAVVPAVVPAAAVVPEVPTPTPPAESATQEVS